MKTFQPIYIYFYFFVQHICNAQAPIDLLKKEKYHPIQYNSKVSNSNIQFKNDSLINAFLNNSKISELVFRNVYTNVTFISSLIPFEIKDKKFVFNSQIPEDFDNENLDLLLIKIMKENIKYEDFLNLKNSNTLGLFIYLAYPEAEMGYEIVELKGKKELLIKKEKMNYLTLEKID